MSQRLFTVLAVIVLFVAAGLIAISQGHGLIISGDDLNSKILSLIIPATALLAGVSAYLDVIDSRVASGELAAGDIAALFGMREFYVLLVSVFAGVLQIFGFEVVSPDTQTAVVVFISTLAWVLLRSFANRAPQSNQTAGDKILSSL